MTSVQEEKPPSEGPPKTRIQDLRNAELVSRYLAATPPYLYSALPMQPHAFFFSEMLRSFVNARHGCRSSHYHRRFKRRSQKYFAENENDTWQQRRSDWPKPEEEKKENEPIRLEVPLELTVDKPIKMRAVSPRSLSPKCEPPKSSSSPGPPGRRSSFVDVGTEEGLTKPPPGLGRNPEPVPQSNLILPPPPPMWYPPIYNPQFGVDPLNFFIDLRVSGHIYDRKRMAADDETMNQDMKVPDGLDKRLGFGQRPRHLSAFTVPVRSTNVTVDAPAKYFDHTIPERAESGKVNGTSYIMKNLKQVYDNLKQSDDVNEDAKVERDGDSKASSDFIDGDI